MLYNKSISFPNKHPINLRKYFVFEIGMCNSLSTFQVSSRSPTEATTVCLSALYFQQPLACLSVCLLQEDQRGRRGECKGGGAEWKVGQSSRWSFPYPLGSLWCWTMHRLVPNSDLHKGPRKKMQNVHMIYCHFEFKRICKKPKVINRMIIVDFDLPPSLALLSLSLYFPKESRYHSK